MKPYNDWYGLTTLNYITSTICGLQSLWAPRNFLYPCTENLSGLYRDAVYTEMLMSTLFNPSFLHTSLPLPALLVSQTMVNTLSSTVSLFCFFACLPYLLGNGTGVHVSRGFLCHDLSFLKYLRWSARRYHKIIHKFITETHRRRITTTIFTNIYIFQCVCLWKYYDTLKIEKSS